MTVYHFASEDGFEDYAWTLLQKEELIALYERANSPFTIVELPDDDEDCPFPDHDSFF